jgi:hypothetical protein
MDDENYGFCPHCGENLRSDAVYCPACGTVLKQEAVQNNYRPNYSSGKTPMGGVFMVAFIMLVLYALLELIGSGSMLAINESTYDTINQIMIDTYGQTFSEYMFEATGVELTKEVFLKEVMIMGVTGVISAILAGISAFFCYKREKFKFAVGFCVVASVVVIVGYAMAPTMGGLFAGALNMAIGLIVAAMIRSSRGYFNS